MLSRFRCRLTYSNVVASLALFIALGGVSYAAAKLPKNSVGSTQIKKNAVTGSKVKNSSLTGSDIKNRSLTAADFNGSIQGPQGAQGAQGAQGPQGVQGPAGPNMQVKDASGGVVGKFLGIFPAGYSIFMVERDGGYWIYLGSGQVYSLGSPNWKTNDCLSTAYLRNSSSNVPAATFGALVGGPFRAAFRTQSAGGFGPVSAWRATGATETLGAATQLYKRDSTTGACVTDGAPTTGELATLTAVEAPPDVAGPLTVG